MSRGKGTDQGDRPASLLTTIFLYMLFARLYHLGKDIIKSDFAHKRQFDEQLVSAIIASFRLYQGFLLQHLSGA
ncbi:hypothetical protein ACO0LC_07475 [Undibacterium sp. JH2W]|uniref:hypothetical protein n=1 Tax=Undibacterium sp. JH2W TaxID=3413037 RepID=UPI003BF27EF2